MKINIKLLSLFTIFAIVGFFFGRYWGVSYMHQRHMGEHHIELGMDGENDREGFVEMKNQMIGTMIAEGNYKCCLEKPCVYCIEKTPGHGEGATCTCLEDIMNGVHPCGECIGEILEGHGNRFIAKYFASALAEEVGKEHLNTLKQIISEKYKISIEEQV
jgi:hypothetical protein